MAKLPTQLLACIFFIVLVLYSSPATSQEVEDESEFSYDENSDHGPARWGEIHPEEWGFCSNGTMQSPIDMSNERVKIVSHLGRLKKSYKPSNATLKNRGHDMMLEWEGEAGAIEINGIEYELRQCHWHSPSEHTINGRRYNLEVHMVHESADGKIAVIGIMYKIGRPDPFLSSLVEHLTAITDVTEGERAVGVIDPRQIKFGSRKYYRYLGSLTTPPCTENVVWSIVRKVRTVTREQVRLLRVAVHDDSDTNARPLQPLNNRPIQLFRPDDDEEN